MSLALHNVVPRALGVPRGPASALWVSGAGHTLANPPRSGVDAGPTGLAGGLPHDEAPVDPPVHAGIRGSASTRGPGAGRRIGPAEARRAAGVPRGGASNRVSSA